MRILVTGANGHLGNNVVRFFLNEDAQVIAGVRKNANVSILNGLKVEIVYLEYHDEQALTKSFQNVDIVVHVAAVFKRWAKNVKRDIIDENIRLSKNIVNAAANAGVQKLIYVSSIAALNDRELPMDERSWNSLHQRPYPYSKALSEKMALQTSKERGLNICSVLPAAIIGPYFCYLTPTLKIFADIADKKLPVLPPFNFLFVDVKDVAKGISLAIKNGKNGERYILAFPKAYSVEDVFDIAIHRLPDLKLKKPARASKLLVHFFAWLGETASSITGKEPLMTVEDFKEFWNGKPSINPNKAKLELGFEASPVEDSFIDTFRYYIKNKSAIG